MAQFPNTSPSKNEILNAYITQMHSKTWRCSMIFSMFPNLWARVVEHQGVWQLQTRQLLRHLESVWKKVPSLEGISRRFQGCRGSGKQKPPFRVVSNLWAKRMIFLLDIPPPKQKQADSSPGWFHEFCLFPGYCQNMSEFMDPF